MNSLCPKFVGKISSSKWEAGPSGVLNMGTYYLDVSFRCVISAEIEHVIVIWKLHLMKVSGWHKRRQRILAWMLYVRCSVALHESWKLSETRQATAKSADCPHLQAIDWSVSDKFHRCLLGKGTSLRPANDLSSHSLVTTRHVCSTYPCLLTDLHFEAKRPQGITMLVIFLLSGCKSEI